MITEDWFPSYVVPAAIKAVAGTTNDCRNWPTICKRSFQTQSEMGCLRALHEKDSMRMREPNINSNLVNSKGFALILCTFQNF